MASTNKGYVETSGVYFREFQPSRLIRSPDYLNISSGHSAIVHVGSASSYYRYLWYRHDALLAAGLGYDSPNSFGGGTAITPAHIRFASGEPLEWHWTDGQYKRRMIASASFPSNIYSLPDGTGDIITTPISTSFVRWFDNTSQTNLHKMPYYQLDDIIGQLQGYYNDMFDNPAFNVRHPSLYDSVVFIGGEFTTIGRGFGNTNLVGTYGVPCPQLDLATNLKLNNLNIKPTSWFTDTSDITGVLPGIDRPPLIDAAQQISNPWQFVRNFAAVVNLASDQTHHGEWCGDDVIRAHIGEADYTNNPQYFDTASGHTYICGCRQTVTSRPLDMSIFNSEIYGNFIEKSHDVDVSFTSNVADNRTATATVTDRFGNTKNISYNWRPKWRCVIRAPQDAFLTPFNLIFESGGFGPCSINTTISGEDIFAQRFLLTSDTLNSNDIPYSRDGTEPHHYLTSNSLWFSFGGDISWFVYPDNDARAGFGDRVELNGDADLSFSSSDISLSIDGIDIPVGSYTPTMTDIIGRTPDNPAYIGGQTTYNANFPEIEGWHVYQMTYTLNITNSYVLCPIPANSTNCCLSKSSVSYYIRNSYGEVLDSFNITGASAASSCYEATELQTELTFSTMNTSQTLNSQCNQCYQTGKILNFFGFTDIPRDFKFFQDMTIYASGAKVSIANASDGPDNSLCQNCGPTYGAGWNSALIGTPFTIEGTLDIHVRHCRSDGSGSAPYICSGVISIPIPTLNLAVSTQETETSAPLTTPGPVCNSWWN